MAVASLQPVTYTPFHLLRELRGVPYNEVQQNVTARLPLHRFDVPEQATQGLGLSSLGLKVLGSAHLR
jgi:hypothetical protein